MSSVSAAKQPFLKFGENTLPFKTAYEFTIQPTVNELHINCGTYLKGTKPEGYFTYILHMESWEKTKDFIKTLELPWNLGNILVFPELQRNSETGKYKGWVDLTICRSYPEVEIQYFNDLMNDYFGNQEAEETDEKGVTEQKTERASFSEPSSRRSSVAEGRAFDAGRSTKRIFFEEGEKRAVIEKMNDLLARVEKLFANHVLYNQTNTISGLVYKKTARQELWKTGALRSGPKFDVTNEEITSSPYSSETWDPQQISELIQNHERVQISQETVPSRRSLFQKMLTKLHL